MGRRGTEAGLGSAPGRGWGRRSEARGGGGWRLQRPPRRSGWRGGWRGRGWRGCSRPGTGRTGRNCDQVGTPAVDCVCHSCSTSIEAAPLQREQGKLENARADTERERARAPQPPAGRSPGCVLGCTGRVFELGTISGGLGQSEESWRAK